MKKNFLFLFLFLMLASSLNSIAWTPETDILEHRIITNFTNDQLDIELHTKSAKSAILNIYDINGNLVAADNYPVLTGLNIFHFNTNSFKSGTYLFALTVDGKKLFNDKFIIVR